jgi:hypothetical protein
VRKMYEESAARQRALACLRKDMYANILRYIRERLQMGTKTVAQMNTILAESLYLRFNKAHLEKPGPVPNDGLRDHVLATDATYMYLLQLSDFKKSDESIARYQALHDDVVACIAKLDLENSPAFGAFPGAYQWLSDLDEFEACFHEGMRTAWKFKQTDLSFATT